MYCTLSVPLMQSILWPPLTSISSLYSFHFPISFDKTVWQSLSLNAIINEIPLLGGLMAYLKTHKLQCLRILFFFLLYLSFCLIPLEAVEKESICLVQRHFGAICPTCGITRAFSSIMHLQFAKAFTYPPIFTVAIFPIITFLVANDVFRLLTNRKKSTEHPSLFTKFAQLFAVPWR